MLPDLSNLRKADGIVKVSRFIYYYSELMTDYNSTKSLF